MLAEDVEITDNSKRNMHDYFRATSSEIRCPWLYGEIAYNTIYSQCFERNQLHGRICDHTRALFCSSQVAHRKGSNWFLVYSMPNIKVDFHSKILLHDSTTPTSTLLSFFLTRFNVHSMIIWHVQSCLSTCLECKLRRSIHPLTCTSQQAQLKSTSAHRFATVLPQVSKSDLQRMQVRVLIGEFLSPFMTPVRCDSRGCSQCRSRRSAASTPPSYRYLRASTPARIWRRRPSSIRSVSSIACSICLRLLRTRTMCSSSQRTRASDRRTRRTPQAS
jgi:hypothetical protein